MTKTDFSRACGLLVVAGFAASAFAQDAGRPHLLASICRPAQAATEYRPTLMETMATVAMRAKDPSSAWRRMMWHLESGNRCYAEDGDPVALANDLAIWGLREPANGPLGTIQPKFLTANTVWNANVPVGVTATGTSSQARRTTLTYSFPADGVTWGQSSSGFAAGPNALNSATTNLFGAGNVDRGREIIRQSLASWRRYGGITYTEVDDDDSVFSTSTLKSGTRGDIRIGGLALGTATTVLAYNNFPSSGGDMVINTSYIINGSNLGNSANNYRYWRNVCSHEHGHGLGYNHVVPCNQTKLMEPQISTTTVDMVAIDERRGVGRNYGDRFAGNNSAANAVNFGDLTQPSTRSVIYRDLSTNGSTGVNSTNQDWFRFTLTTAQDVTITATPTGDSYTNNAQTTGCTPPASPTTIVASNAGVLSARLFDSTGTTAIVQTPAGSAGVASTVQATLQPGTYTVQVIDVGPSTNQIVQLYDLTLRVGTSFARPDPIAGIHKRVQANTICYFDGRPNSQATEVGATISTYSWDLDGDGTYDVPNSPSPTKMYVSNGVFPATLRVTDSNGMQATDTINVTVYGAETNVTSISPSSADQATTVAVILTGTNFLGVQNASQVTVSGTGVSVLGTPVVNALGTRITGLSFVVAANASAGARDITVTNSDGLGTSGTSISRFTVIALPVPCSPADIAYGDGEPLPPIGASGGFNPIGPDGGDFDCFFNYYFAAAPANAICDIAYGDGEPLPPFGLPGGFNPGVDGGDFDCFFNYYFASCP